MKWGNWCPLIKLLLAPFSLSILPTILMVSKIQKSHVLPASNNVMAYCYSAQTRQNLCLFLETGRPYTPASASSVTGLIIGVHHYTCFLGLFTFFSKCHCQMPHLCSLALCHMVVLQGGSKAKKTPSSYFSFAVLTSPQR